MVLKKGESFFSEASRWALRKTTTVYLNIRKYAPLQQISYVKSLEQLSNKMKGLKNIHKTDSKGIKDYCKSQQQNSSYMRQYFGSEIMLYTLFMFQITSILIFYSFLRLKNNERNHCIYIKHFKSLLYGCRLTEPVKYCLSIEVPKKSSCKNFESYNKNLLFSFVVYADTEANFIKYTANCIFDDSNI